MLETAFSPIRPASPRSEPANGQPSLRIKGGWYKSARHFAAFLGLTPKQHSTGGRQRLGRISKQGDGYIRRLLILGGTALVRYARDAGSTVWAKQLLVRRPARVVTVALANKAARIIWALLVRGGVYRSAAPQAA